MAEALNYAVSEGVMTSKMNVGSEAIGDHGNCVFHINSVVELCGRTENCTGSPGLSTLERGEEEERGKEEQGDLCIIALVFSPSVESSDKHT